MRERIPGAPVTPEGGSYDWASTIFSESSSPLIVWGSRALVESIMLAFWCRRGNALRING